MIILLGLVGYLYIYIWYITYLAATSVQTNILEFWKHHLISNPTPVARHKARRWGTLKTPRYWWCLYLATAAPRWVGIWRLKPSFSRGWNGLKVRFWSSSGTQWSEKAPEHWQCIGWIALKNWLTIQHVLPSSPVIDSFWDGHMRSAWCLFLPPVSPSSVR